MKKIIILMSISAILTANNSLVSSQHTGCKNNKQLVRHPASGKTKAPAIKIKTSQSEDDIHIISTTETDFAIHKAATELQTMSLGTSSTKAPAKPASRLLSKRLRPRWPIKQMLNIPLVESRQIAPGFYILVLTGRITSAPLHTLDQPTPRYCKSLLVEDASGNKYKIFNNKSEIAQPRIQAFGPRYLSFQSNSI